MDQLPVSEMRRVVEQEAFNNAKGRIEASKRIRAELSNKVAGGPRPPIEAKLQAIELASKQGEVGRLAGNQETYFDTRGYQEARANVTYVSPKDETITEQLVSFVKADQKGQPEIYKNSDGFSMLNADLYDSKLPSQLHAQGNDHNTHMLPRVDGKGAYVGIVTVQTSKR